MIAGPHVNRCHVAGGSLAANIEAAIEDAHASADFVVGAVAVFIGGPHKRQITLETEGATKIRDLIEKSGLIVIAHNVYNASPWRGDPDAARFIRDEVKVCASASIGGLVVHLPKLPISSVMKYIDRLVVPGVEGVRVYFETPAVTPKESYYDSPEKLADLFREIRDTVDPDLERFGLCIDTAHLWTNGVDLSSGDSASAWLSRLESFADIIPPHCVMLHLNDSERERGRGPDSHAALTKGRIWADNEGGLRAFIDYARRHNIPTILERPECESLVDDYHVLQRLA